FYIVLGIGIVLVIAGFLMSMSNPPAAGGDHHAMAEQLVASTLQDHGHAEGRSNGFAYALKRLYTSLWMNNMFFVGIGIIGLFFVAIHYAAQAGWSAGVIRIPLAMGTWIPIAGILT